VVVSPSADYAPAERSVSIEIKGRFADASVYQCVFTADEIAIDTPAGVSRSRANPHRIKVGGQNLTSGSGGCV
jgi:hypothetical protein